MRGDFDPYVLVVEWPRADRAAFVRCYGLALAAMRKHNCVPEAKRKKMKWREMTLAEQAALFDDPIVRKFIESHRPGLLARLAADDDAVFSYWMLSVLGSLGHLAGVFAIDLFCETT